MRRQFTLSDLVIETFLIAAARGCFVNATGVVELPLMVGGVIFSCAAFGGLFGPKGMLVGFGIPSVAVVVHVIERLLPWPID